MIDTENKVKILEEMLSETGNILLKEVIAEKDADIDRLKNAQKSIAFKNDVDPYEVVKLINSGRTIGEVANYFHITEQTVRNRARSLGYRVIKNKLYSLVNKK